MNELEKRIDPDIEKARLALLKETESTSGFQNKQNRIRAKMQKNRKRRFLPIFLVIIPFFAWLFPHRLYLMAIFFVSCFFFFHYRSMHNEDYDNDFLYAEHFFCPVLKIIYPAAIFTYKGDIDRDMDILKQIIPSTDRYETRCCVRFHDHDDLEICNVYAHHTEKGTEDKHAARQEVTDFRGQVYATYYPSTVHGYIRVVPTGEMQIAGSQVRPHYFHFDDDSMKIETEDIQNNERYAISCTDELAARKFLNPSVLKWLDEQIEVPISIYITQNRMYFALYTNKKIFSAPSGREGIDSLSLTGVYKNLQQEINKAHDLINALHTHA